MSGPSMETPEQAAQQFIERLAPKGYTLTKLYPYYTADGAIWCWRIRAEHPTDPGKWMRPMRRKGHGFEIGEPTTPKDGKPLYRLPELLAADPAKPVFIVEGEKCADALWGLGCIATTSGSCTSADTADWTTLESRQSLGWPDNDAAGRKHIDAAATRLRALGASCEVLDVAALGLPDKGDCVDWLAMHPEATAADVLALPRLPAAHPQQARDAAPLVELHRASDIVCQPIHWIWPGWLAGGKLHILAGAPGTGKTTIAMALAAAVSSGGQWPCGTSAPIGNVLIWSGEDDPADTLVPRLKAAGANLTRVFFVGDVRDGDEARAFDPATDLAALESEAERIGDIALLIADPVVNAVVGDSHKNTEVRRSLQPLVTMATRLGAAVLGITHFSKGSAGKDPTERVIGSVAFGALARVVLVTARNKDDEARLLARAKSNIGPDGGGFAYVLEQVDHDGLIASVTRWGASLDGSASDLLGVAEADGTEGTAREEASDWLRDELANGPRPTAQLKPEATKAGISWRTVERAKADLGVKSEKSGFTGEWKWSLPKTAQDRQGRQEIERGNLGGLGGLGSLGERHALGGDGEGPDAAAYRRASKGG